MLGAQVPVPDVHACVSVSLVWMLQCARRHRQQGVVRSVAC